MDIKIYNTLTNQREKLIPKEDGIIKFYSCGPTTYDLLHVGNARALVVADIFYRILTSLDYKVTFVRNFTDVDDKIIKKAQEQNSDPLEHSQKYIDEALKDMLELNLLPPSYTPKVSESMIEIIDMIQRIIDKGHAYVVEGEVLYHVPSFKEYGKLSNRDLNSLQHGKRVNVEDHKKHPSDFVLWKPHKDGEPYWESPWGKGRPGWHIECSAMAKKYLGGTIDLHHGGVDLIFPHHENEVAQSESANGEDFCKHWCHNEHLHFGNEKMSKSLGNVITIRDFVTKYSGQTLRQIFLSSHYRARITWSEDVVAQAINDSERIHQFVIEVKNNHETTDNNNDYTLDISEINQLMTSVKESLASDFNVPKALSYLFNLIRNIRRKYLQNQETIPFKVYNKVDEFLSLMKYSLGVITDNPEKTLITLNEARKNLKGEDQNINEDDIKKLIEDRLNAKKEKNWAKADEIRDTLKKNNIVLLDRPDGTTDWKYNS